jgi:hypothetical protein
MLYASDPAAGGEIREEALLLLVGAEQVDALEPDRLVDTHDDRERRVDLGERLEHTGVAGLREALAAIALRDIQAAEPAVAQLLHEAVAEPAPFLDLARVHLFADLPGGGAQPADLLLLGGVGLWPREHHLLVDLPAEQ